jgi:hypothetical protein
LKRASGKEGEGQVDNTVLYIPRDMMRRVDGEESILGTELVEPK